MESITSLLRLRAEQQPDRCAYTFLEDGELDARALSYGEIDRRARALAAHLATRARRGERALIVMAPGLAYIASFFGCLYAGLVAVPVPVPDRRRGLPRLRAIIRDCTPSLALTTGDVLAMVDVSPEDELGAVSWLAIDDIADDGAERWDAPRTDAATLAFLQYTSGSTGMPKGVVLTHGNLLHNQQLIQRGFAHSSESVIVGWLPPHHDMGLIGNILQPLYLGVPCVQMAPHHFLTKPSRWLAAISRYRGTTSGGPNFAYELCTRRVTEAQAAELDLSSWAVAFNGAEPVRAATIDRFSAAFAAAGFRRDAFYPCYGLAEATLFVSGGVAAAPPVVRAVERDALERGAATLVESTAEAVTLVGCGQRRDGLDVRIVDPVVREECDDGRVGEIWVAGGSVAQGYWQRPDDTAETFRAGLRSGEGPFLRTGDLGFCRDGELYVTGRLKDLVIIRGRNLYPQDIELTVEEAHPSLRAGGGAAFAVDVDGEERLVVVQEVGHRAPADAAEIAARARGAIADRHEVAVHAIVFIRAGSLPRTTSGKVQRRACRARFLDGSLQVVWESQAARVASVESPVTAVEIALAAIWTEVLGCAVGRAHDFLELGGDSLRAMQVVARVRDVLGVELDVAQLFESRTLADLAAVIEARPRAAAVRDVPPRPSRLPLSLVQERLWFLEQLVAGAPVYHLAAALRLDGELDVRRLERALTALVARHESLRTRFPLVDGELVQQIDEPAPVALTARVLETTSIEDAVGDELRQPFDLGERPPVRWVLLRATERDHVLAVVCHHIVADGWSTNVLLRDLVRLYGGDELAPLPLQPADHALVERAGRHEAQLAYWRTRLADAPRLDVPTDRPRPAVQTYLGARAGFALPPTVVDGLVALGHRERTTLFAAIVAGLSAVLGRYTGQRELVLGTPVAMRPRAELEGVVGCLLNTLALRVDVGGNPRAVELVARVGATLAAAQRHQDVPFERVLEQLALPRDLSRAPLFQVMVAMQPTVQPSPAVDGLHVSIEQLATGTAQLDLAFDIVRDDDGVRVACEYNTDLFDAATIERLLAQWQTTLGDMAARPAARLSELAPAEPPPPATAVEVSSARIHEQFVAEALRRPDAIALIDGAIRLDYATVSERVQRLAHHLRRFGVGPEVRVGIALARAADAVIAALAVLAAGGAYVPLDPAHPVERLGYVLADADVAVVITRGDLIASLPVTTTTFVCLDRDAAAIARAPVSALAPTDPDGLAYIIYTSGSTGRPKGVMVTHRTLASAAAAWRAVYPLSGEELRLLQVANPAFDVWTADWVRALGSGGTLVIAPPEVAVDPDALGELLERERVTVVDLVPAIATLLRRGLGSLRVLIVGSDVWQVRDYHALRERCGSDTRLLSCYGVTEATIDSAWCDAELEGRAAESAVPLGRAFPNTRLYVLDPYGSPAPVGVPGELVIGGAGVARGYWRRPDLTAERFVPDPFADEPGARMYRTGDRARQLADGTLEFLGRLDDQVKVRGVRIEVGEIEARLRQHPDIHDAVVVVRDQRLVAYAVAVAERAPTTAAVNEHLRAQLPEAMVPAALVWLEALPLSPNGKVDRRALPAPARAVAAESTQPTGEIERVLAAIWQEVLDVAIVGVDDNFFDLGGHSLLLAQVRARITSALGRDVALLDLFRYPTIRALAAALGGARPRAPRERERDERAPIAIVGMAGRFPGAPDVSTFWRNLCEGVESVTTLGDDELRAAGVDPALFARPDYVRARAILDGIDQFDADFFGFTPRDAAALDPQHRLLLECAWEVFESAGYDPRRIDGRVGVFAGSSTNGYQSLLFPDGVRVESAGDLAALLALDKDFLTTRVSYKLGLEGPSVAVQTACSTSLVAVHLACQALLAGDCELALAGGVSVSVPQQVGYLYQEGAIAAPDGHCRAFDADARGTVAGSGVGVVLLKRLADALADGDAIVAVIRGSAVNNDGHDKIGYTAPRVDGQARVIREAQVAAGVDPGSITYVEAHGTGTPLGDPIEIAALTQAFRHGTERRGFCAIGSVKTNVGHLDAAAGVTGLIKTALALAHRRIPPSLHFRTPNPSIDFAASPFFVATELAAWTVPAGQPRRAGVSSFGLGGTNAHVVLEEAATSPAVHRAERDELFVLSARSPRALEQLSDALATALETRGDLALADVAHTLRVGRRAFPYRRAVVGGARAQVARAFRERGVVGPVTSPRRVVFAFPGQGTQHVDMARELYEGEAVFRAAVDEAAERLGPRLGVDLRRVMFAGASGGIEAAAQLDRTSITQPALFVVEHALARLWMAWGVTPDAMIGHSVGEYVAACIAGCLSVDDALALVAERGRLMEATPPGAMLAVAATEAELAPWIGDGVALAAVNAPRQCVLSGAPDAIDAVERALVARALRTSRVRTTRAFHSHLMDAALAAFRDAAAGVTFGAPTIPWVSNLTGTWVTERDARDPDYWVRHLRGTVRFADGVRTLQATDHVLLEVGPGQTLSRLARQVGEGIAIASLPVESAAGELWASGAGIDLAAFGRPARRVALPTTPFERQRHWIEAKPRETRIEQRELDDWFYVPSWKRAPIAPAVDTASGRWLVLADDADLLAGLAAPGRHVTVVGSAQLRLDAPADLRRLVSDHRPTHVIHAWSLEDAGFHDAQRRDAASVVWLAQALAELPSTQLVVLSAGLHDLTGRERLRPEHASLLGVARTIVRELPHLRCRVVDIDTTDRLVERVLAEAESTADDPVVVYRAGHRWLPTLEPTRLAAAPSRLRDRGVYLVTGGLGGVGLLAAEELARTARARLILTGRSEPSEAQRARVRELEQLGAEVLVRQADVTDAAQMRTVIGETQARFGALHGVIHAAGAAGGGVLERIQPAALAAELAGAKALGALVLDEVTCGIDLDFLLLCSSLTAWSGGIAQAGYAAANAFLEAFAQARTRAGAYTVAVAFDRWQDVGMAARAAEQLRALGLGELARAGMTAAQGQEVLRRVLAGAALAQVAVSVRPLHGLPDDDEGRALASRLGVGNARRTSHTASGDTASTTEIAALWARALGVAEVPADADFFSLGGDSLLALQILNQVRDAFGVDLSLRDFFTRPTVAGLAALVTADRAPPPAEPALVALPRAARRLPPS